MVLYLAYYNVFGMLINIDQTVTVFFMDFVKFMNVIGTFLHFGFEMPCMI